MFDLHKAKTSRVALALSGLAALAFTFGSPPNDSLVEFRSGEVASAADVNCNFALLKTGFDSVDNRIGQLENLDLGPRVIDLETQGGDQESRLVTIESYDLPNRTATLETDYTGLRDDMTATTCGLRRAGPFDYRGIPTSIVNVGSVTLNCPGDGFILIHCQARSVFFGNATILELGVDLTPSSLGTDHAVLGRLDGNETLRFSHFVSYSAMLPCSSGPNTIFANARKDSVFDEHEINVGDLVLTALFIPKMY